MMDDPTLVAPLLAVCGYLIASWNFPLTFHRLGWIPDPRGGLSGNPGVSNVYRIAGPAWAALVLVLDVTRAAGLGLASLLYLPFGWVPVVGVGLIAGNRWPLFHGFQGGKGVASYLGFTAAVAPWACLTGAAAWVGVYWLSHRTFVSSFAMILALGVGTVLEGASSLVGLIGTGVSVVLIVTAHRPNLAAWRAERERASGGRDAGRRPEDPLG